ncbi:hypothetical protein AMK68_03075, partial [candidate division KD3-62 bacterium DG_56]
MAVLVLGAAAATAGAWGGAPGWDNWNCNLHVYWGALYGSPEDTGCYFGVQPTATDGYDLIDSKDPPTPSGNYVNAFWWHPGWVDDLGDPVGPLMADWRAPITPEGASKQWGKAHAVPVLPPTDYWAVETNYNLAETGCMDPCWNIVDYPIAASVYVTWIFGVTQTPPPPVPPEDYTFTIVYKHGLNSKPTACMEAGVTTPAKDTAWDMEVTDHIVIPVWSLDFVPYAYPACDGTESPPDRAKFFVIVNNPDTTPTCTIDVDPPSPQEEP